jgi:hypothetical protein
MNQFVCTVISMGMLVFLSFPQSAGACFIGLERHTLDPEEEQLDSTPPGQAEVLLLDIIRGRGPQFTGTGWSGSSVDDTGIVVLEPVPTPDDRTPLDKIGYRIEHIDGKLPEGLIPDYDVRPAEGLLYLYWHDGATDNQESLDFTLSFRAIDLGGNLGAPSEPVEIKHPGSQGCASTGFTPTEPGVFLLLLMAWTWKRSKR